MPKQRRAKSSRVRTRQWEGREDTYSRDAAKHVRTSKTLPAPSGGEQAVRGDIVPNAVVVSPYGVLCFVELDGEEVLCSVGDGLIEGKSSILAPGDLVYVERDAERGVVQAMLPRRTKLSRPTIGRGRPGERRQSEQVFAANIDQLIVVAAAARPWFKPGLVDRYLIAAEVGGVTPLLCVNKMDLVEDEPEPVRLYRELGVAVFGTSCETGAGLESFRAALRGKRTVFAGQSGVGKSSLLNALDPNLSIVTREVSNANEKGRHTTTSSRLYHLAQDIHIIDTPGIRQLGLWGVSHEELAYYFPELERISEACRFRDCTHTHEPQCAVLEAVESGAMSRFRYTSYLHIRESL